MAYTKYSLTPANNNAAPPDGAPEGMLPSAVNDTMRDMMAQIRDCGDGIRGGTYTMTAPVITGGSISGSTMSSNVITGGSINNTPIGASTANTGAFTTLAYSSTLTGGTGVVNLGSGQFYKDASGNVGIGKIPSAWTSGRTAIEMSGSSTAVYFAGGTLNTVFSNNYLYNSGDKFINSSGYATSYQQQQTGTHAWYTSSVASVSAGSTATMNEVMKINPNGSIGSTATADTTFTNCPFTVSIASTNGYAAGVGSGILFNAIYTGGGSSAGVGSISGVKENATDGNYAGALTFMTRANGSGGGNQERMRINSNGNIILQGGTATADGVGISFPSTQAGSSNANCLDDYEEGTWTPEFIALSGSLPTITYGTRYGKYTKIGNTVTASFLLPWSSTGGGGSGLLAISMPFAPYQDGGAHNGFGGVAYASGLPVNALFYGDSGATRAIFIKAGTVNSYYSPAEISSGGGQLMGSFIFQTT